MVSHRSRNRISHSIRHQVQKLSPDWQVSTRNRGHSRERGHRPLRLAPNGAERLVHHCQRLRIVYIRSEILRGHSGPSFAGGSAIYLSQPPVPVAVPLLVIIELCAPSVASLRPLPWPSRAAY